MTGQELLDRRTKLAESLAKAEAEAKRFRKVARGCSVWSRGWKDRKASLFEERVRAGRRQLVDLDEKLVGALEELLGQGVAPGVLLEQGVPAVLLLEAGCSLPWDGTPPKPGEHVDQYADGRCEVGCVPLAAEG